MLKNNRKLSRELSLGILLMAAPVLALSLGVLYKQSRKMIHNEVIECTNSTLNTTLHRIRNYMSTVETAANTNVWMCEENFSPQSLQNLTVTCRISLWELCSHPAHPVYSDSLTTSIT